MAGLAGHLAAGPPGAPGSPAGPRGPYPGPPGQYGPPHRPMYPGIIFFIFVLKEYALVSLYKRSFNQVNYVCIRKNTIKNIILIFNISLCFGTSLYFGLSPFGIYLLVLSK